MQNTTQTSLKTSEILDILKPEVDYGLLSGFEKPILLKSGAEKIRFALGLNVESLDCVNEVFYYGKPYIDVT